MRLAKRGNERNAFYIRELSREAGQFFVQRPDVLQNVAFGFGAIPEL